jgi:hypothetical protein
MPHIYRLNETHGFPEAIIATFGGVELQPLKPNDLVVLAQGKSPHIGILIDFLNNFHQSAKARLPVYKGHLEKYSLEAGRSAIEVAVVSVSGLMGAGLSSRLFEAATRAIGKTI